jgi:2-desacetyl-2-hydroxyethyl bacteriochlorophyllide A dehydrogenase
MLSHKLIFSEPFCAKWIDVELPDPGPGEIMVRTHKTLVSTGTELTAFMGDFEPHSVWARYITYPYDTVGYSNVGEVAALGPGVSNFKIGQRVVTWGSHASYNLVPLAYSFATVQAIPDEVTDDQALLCNLGKTVMNGIRLARITMGDAVIVVGLGILGQLAVQFADISGAFPLIAVDLSQQRLDMARAHGATHTCLGDRDELKNEISKITHGRMADVILEVTGNQHVIPSVFRWVRQMGRVILMGSPRGKVEVDFHDEVHVLGLQVIGARVSTTPEVETPYNPWTADRNGELFFDLVRAGKLRLNDLITHRYSWKDAPEAYRTLAEDRTQTMGVAFEGWENEAAAVNV